MRTFIFISLLFALSYINAPMSLFAMESYVLGEPTKMQSFRFNNENWFTLPHPTVVSFSVLHDGSAFGFTDTGVRFTQYTIPNTAGVRVQRFEIQDHYHYIIDGEAVYGMTEFSARLARAYAEKNAT